MESMGPDLLFLCYKMGSALSHLAVMCRSEPPPWVSVARDGQALLQTVCLSGSWGHVLGYISCVLPLDCSTCSSIMGKLGQLQFSHFFVHKQKAALLHGEEGAGDM